MENVAEKIDLERSSDKALREHALTTAKNFKTAWVDLGRVLFSIWRDKTFHSWGYEKFETYVAKEIGIRKQTALKLLKTYGFLEKEEPLYLQEEYIASQETAQVPTYETIDVLRLAKNKKQLESKDYIGLKEKVFMQGKDAKEVRQDLTAIIREREELEPEEAWQKKKETSVKRFISNLKSITRELEEMKLLSGPVIEDINTLVRKLEQEI